MSFLRAITPNIRKEISVKTPDGEQQFLVLWKRPNDDQRLELIAAINSRAEAMNAAKTAAEQQEATKQYVIESRARIKSFLHGWELKDGDLNVDFNDTNVDEMLQWTEYRNPLDASLMNVLSLTQEDAKAGNSLSADSTSPAPTTVEK
jgi:hypothetical protein